MLENANASRRTERTIKRMFPKISVCMTEAIRVLNVQCMHGMLARAWLPCWMDRWRRRWLECPEGRSDVRMYAAIVVWLTSLEKTSIKCFFRCHYMQLEASEFATDFSKKTTARTLLCAALNCRTARFKAPTWRFALFSSELLYWVCDAMKNRHGCVHAMLISYNTLSFSLYSNADSQTTNKSLGNLLSANIGHRRKVRILPIDTDHVRL